MDDMLLKVIDKLVEKTRAGRVEWEDITPGLTGERFRALVDEVSVEVMDGERASDRRSDDEEVIYLPYYRLLVLNRRGAIVTQVIQEEGEEHYRRLEALFDIARDTARKSGTVLQNLLTSLSK